MGMSEISLEQLNQGVQDVSVRVYVCVMCICIPMRYARIYTMYKYGVTTAVRGVWDAGDTPYRLQSPSPVADPTPSTHIPQRYSSTPWCRITAALMHD